MNYLILDIGGSSIKYALLNETGEFIEKGSTIAPHQSIEQFVEVIGELYDKYAEQIVGMAISMPGAIDPQKGFAYTGGAYKYIKDMEIVKILQERCPLPITIGNDAKCAANAEVGFGCLKDVDDAAVIILGTGIGGCIVRDGKVHIGKHFSSGEFSWMRTNGEDGNNPECVWAATNGIPGLLKAVQESVGTKEQYNGKEIFEMANSGDKKVLAGLDKFCNRLAVQIYNLQALFDPEKIAIGGGISAQPLLLELVEKHIEEMYQTGLKANSPIARPVVVPCQYRNDANLLGAFYQHLHTCKKN